MFSFSEHAIFIDVYVLPRFGSVCGKFEWKGILGILQNYIISRYLFCLSLESGKEKRVRESLGKKRKEKEKERRESKRDNF